MIHCTELFLNAQGAFETLYKRISEHGVNKNGTRYLSDVCFKIYNPQDSDIKTPFRKWSKEYAEKEFDWYLSKNKSVKELKLIAPMWDKMHNGDNMVNSNYGHLWHENGQLANVIDKLIADRNTRQAFITLYDGKRHADYKFDTPCTLSIGFRIEENTLAMSVLMRSNDLWFGFCNDQYCFAKLQKIVAFAVGLPCGVYFHYATDMHIYEKQLNRSID